MAVQVTGSQAKTKGARIAVFGASYKQSIGDIRESPALKMVGLLANQGAELRYHDPHVPTLPNGLV